MYLYWPSVVFMYNIYKHDVIWARTQVIGILTISKHQNTKVDYCIQHKDVVLTIEVFANDKHENSLCDQLSFTISKLLHCICGMLSITFCHWCFPFFFNRIIEQEKKKKKKRQSNNNYTKKNHSYLCGYFKGVYIHTLFYITLLI